MSEAEYLINEIQKAEKIELNKTSRAHIERILEEQRELREYWAIKAKKAEKTLRHGDQRWENVGECK